VKALCDLEMLFPTAFFNVMTHLTLHLVDEVQQYGPLSARTCYPQEQFIKLLKGYVQNRHTPEASMALGSVADETLGYLTEYTTLYSTVTTRVWDAEEEKGSYSEVLEGAARQVHLPGVAIKIAHDYVLCNTESMVP
jgi:hypothetical protein